MYRIGSPAERNETAACSPGRYPDCHNRAEMACTCSVLLGLATITTKVGRFWFSAPKPYDIHAPRTACRYLIACLDVGDGWFMVNGFRLHAADNAHIIRHFPGEQLTDPCS